jgi:hypothetical protein
MRSLILALALGVTVAMPTAAQNTTRTRLQGLTFEHWQGTGSAFLRPTLRFTTYPSRGLGFDFALTVHHDDMSFYPPLLTVGPQIGLTLPLHAGPVTLLLKGGPAGIVSLGLLENPLFRIEPGAHAGLGVIVPIDRKSSVRLEVGRHLYDAFPYGPRLWSFGFGVTGGLRRSRS